MGEDDITHVEEFVALWDYKKFPIANSIAEHRQRYRNNFQQRLLHHHVFDLKSATDLVSAQRLAYFGCGEIKTQPPYFVLADAIILVIGTFTGHNSLASVQFHQE